MKVCSYRVRHEKTHTWRERKLTVPAQGTLYVMPNGLHREQVFSVAVAELRKMIEELYAE